MSGSPIRGKGRHGERVAKALTPPKLTEVVRDEVTTTGAWKALVRGVNLPVHRVLAGVAVGAVGIFPIISKYGLLEPALFMWLWLASYGIKEFAGAVSKGKIVESAQDALININARMGGALQNATQLMMNSADRELSDPSCRSVVESFLQCARDYARVVGNVPDGTRLRACLAVPITKAGATSPSTIRVWCYDDAHPDRRFSELPLPTGDNSEICPGSPECFVRGTVRHISDIHNVDVPGYELKNRAFRSILAVPVREAGTKGKVLAVLNIDADQPDFFGDLVLRNKIDKSLSHIVGLIAFVLLSRKKGCAYGFEHAQISE